MRGHPKAELLSAYLDQELVRGEEARLEGHLTDCLHCQQRLDGLRGVVATLQSVETASVPLFLNEAIPRRISLEERPTSLLDRFENRLKRIYIPAASVPLIFAVVMTLTVVVYFFTWGAYSTRQSATELVVAPARTEAQRTDVGERTFVLEGERWLEEGLAADSWREVDGGSEEGREIFDAEPELRDLLAGNRSALLSWRGETLLLSD